jgi:hypothetical protein
MTVTRIPGALRTLFSPSFIASYLGFYEQSSVQRQNTSKALNPCRNNLHGSKRELNTVQEVLWKRERSKRGKNSYLLTSSTLELEREPLFSTTSVIPT